MDTLDFLEEMFGDLVEEESPHIFNRSLDSSAAAFQMLSLSSVIYNIFVRLSLWGHEGGRVTRQEVQNRQIKKSNQELTGRQNPYNEASGFRW